MSEHNAIITELRARGLHIQAAAEPDTRIAADRVLALILRLGYTTDVRLPKFKDCINGASMRRSANDSDWFAVWPDTFSFHFGDDQHLNFKFHVKPLGWALKKVHACAELHKRVRAAEAEISAKMDELTAAVRKIEERDDLCVYVTKDRLSVEHV